MVPDTHTAGRTDARVTDDRTDEAREAVLNAVLGGAVGIVLAFVPFSPLVGGAVAGYLEGVSGADARTVGAMAGAIMFVPLGLLALYASAGAVNVGPAPLVVGLLGVFVVLVGSLYTVGLSVLGAHLGVCVEDGY